MEFKQIVELGDLKILELFDHEENTFNYYVKNEHEDDFIYMFGLMPKDRLTEDAIITLGDNGYFDKRGDI